MTEAPAPLQECDYIFEISIRRLVVRNESNLVYSLTQKISGEPKWKRLRHRAQFGETGAPSPPTPLPRGERGERVPAFVPFAKTRRCPRISSRRRMRESARIFSPLPSRERRW